MTDTVWSRDEIESPCVKICVLHPEARLCIGCYRSGEEITRWSRMAPEERRAVMNSLPERASTIPKSRRGGREGRIARRRDPAS